MILQKMAATAGLAVSLATAGWGIAATAGTAAADASTTAAHASLAASRTAVSSQDRTFMDQASQINLTEISLGKHAQAHATTATAKKLGAIYAHDHTAAQASLRALASRLHVTLPTTPGAQLESIVAGVEAQKGRNMDLAFAGASVSGHQTAIAIYKKEVSAGSNAAVKAYAVRYLPMLQKHLTLAEHADSVMHVASTR
jgi:putative membrane protein